MRRLPIALLAVALLLGLGTRVAHAQRAVEAMAPAFFDATGQVRGTAFVVTSEGDAVAPDGSVTLREAMQAANANQPVGDAPAGSPDGDVIRFASALDGATIRLGSELAVTDDLFIDGSPVEDGRPVTLDAGENGRIFNVSAGDVQGDSGAVAVTDVVFRNGRAADFGGAVYVAQGRQLGLDAVAFIGNEAGVSGGALVNDGGRVSLGDVTFTGNTARGDDRSTSRRRAATLLAAPPALRASAAAAPGGGAVYNLGGSLSLGDAELTGNRGMRGGGVLNVSGSLTVDRGRFLENSASADGGALATVRGNVSLANVAFRQNTADTTDGRGGALFATGNVPPDAATVTIRGGSFRENSAGSGGAIYSGRGGLSVVSGEGEGRVAFAGNRALGSAGGGALVNDGGTATLDRIAFTSNAAPRAPGGAVANRGGRVSLTGSSITQNRAGGDGGGFYDDGREAPTTLSLIDLTLEQNASGGRGGGLFSDGGQVTLTGGTIGANVAQASGGGAWISGSLTLSDERGTATHVSANVAEGTSPRGGGGAVYNAGGTLSFDHARVVDNEARGGSGGAVYNRGGNVSVVGGALSRNRAARDGGALADDSGLGARLDSTNVTLRDVALDDNRASSEDDAGTSQAGRGGALFAGGGAGSLGVQGGSASGNRAAAGGAFYADGSLTISEVRVADNTAWGAADTQDALHHSGGALHHRDGSASIERSTITGNTSAGSGGAIFHRAPMSAARPNGGTLNVDTTRLAGNRAQGDGGALDVADGQAVLSESIVRGNHSATGRGGAFHIGGTTVVMIFRSTLAENSAGGDGGGVWASSPSTVAIYLSTVSGNAAEGDGGGLYDAAMADDGGVEAGVSLLASTVADNTAGGDGGGVRATAGGRLLVGNTLLARNEADGRGDDCIGPLIATGPNRIGTLSEGSCTLSGAVDQAIVGGAARLSALADHGGPTPTHRLRPDSRAVDAGTAGLPDDTTQTDQRGAARLGNGDLPDLGAVELGAAERPAAVTAFDAAMAEEDRAVRLSWQAPATDASGATAFRVQQRRTAGSDAGRSWATAAVVQRDSSTVSYEYALAGLAPGRYDVRLVQVGGTADGVVLATVRGVEVGLGGAAFALTDVFPNPLRPGRRASLELTVQSPQDVVVTLFDARGRRVRLLHDGPAEAFAPLVVDVAARDLASGLYVVRATGDEFAATRKFIIVR